MSDWKHNNKKDIQRTEKKVKKKNHENKELKHESYMPAKEKDKRMIEKKRESHKNTKLTF